MTTRRSFLSGAAASLAAPRIGWAALGNPVALSAARTSQGDFVLVGLSHSGQIAFDIPLSERGHAAAAHPTVAEAVAIARRPGRIARVLDCATGQVTKILEAPEGRHFYGHGAFNAEGTLLFTTENDIATGDGRIGVWDRNLGYARIDEFSSGGIGPHEIIRLPDGALAVANGGIRTHPATGRDKLNLATMRGNLTLFAPDGSTRDTALVPQDARLNSLRHIAANPNGAIICGFQWQGDLFDVPWLVALYRPGLGLTPCQMSDRDLFGLNGYVGSVAGLGNGGFAATSPRGGRVLTLDKSGSVTANYAASDLCGVVTTAQSGTLASDGFGAVYELTETGLAPRARHALSFDNHLVGL